VKPERISKNEAFRPNGHPLGLHRVIHPIGVLPQAALRLDASLPIFDDEVLVEVEQLHIDSASFRQLQLAYDRDPQRIAQAILKITRERGKMENPVTHSGGMLIGKVAAQGPRAKFFAEVGQSLATLVSLTLTPLHLEEIFQVDLATGQVAARGHAILFASGVAAPLPDDLPRRTALAVLDVCGAPAWVRRGVDPQDRILIVGAGKAGVLSAFAAREKISPERIWISDVSEENLTRAAATGLGAHFVRADAQRAVNFWERHEKAGAQPFDWVVNCANAPETEVACILAAKARGKILFFNMATQFGRAVLSAEGIGKEVEMTMGNGFAEGHWEFALDLVRRHPSLAEFFREEREQ